MSQTSVRSSHGRGNPGGAKPVQETVLRNPRALETLLSGDPPALDSLLDSDHAKCEGISWNDRREWNVIPLM